MKKIFALIAVAVALSACTKEDAAPAATTKPATTTAGTAQTTPTSTSSASIPKECQDYLDKMNACAAKQGGAAGDAMKAGMEQTKAAWANVSGNQAALSGACKAASDAFATQATAMKC